MADAELDVMLEPANDIEDEVNQPSVGVTGEQGGDMTPQQQEQQEGLIAGGVSKGLAAAGIFGALLSQLKSITGIVQAIFGFFSRALLPTVEVIAELIRPLISGINDFISNPLGQITESSQAGLNIIENTTGVELDPVTGENREQPDNFVETLGASILEAFGVDTAQTADQTGEAKKQQRKQNLEDAQRDKLGSQK
jgi:hypothetical protein